MSHSKLTEDKFGTSDQFPSFISYPPFIPILKYDGIKGIFCYFIEHYGHSGYACLIKRSLDKDPNILVRIGDWKGNVIDPQSDELASKILSSYVPKLASVMKITAIGQAMYYFSSDLILVDMRLSSTKFAGPGMLNDVVGKVVPTQKILAIKHLDSETLENVKNGIGRFSGDVLIKPSKFRTIQFNNAKVPLYVEIVR